MIIKIQKKEPLKKAHLNNKIENVSPQSLFMDSSGKCKLLLSGSSVVRKENYHVIKLSIF